MTFAFAVGSVLLGAALLRRGLAVAQLPPPPGLPQSWPIFVDAFERGGGLGEVHRRSRGPHGRKPWDWRPVVVAVDEDRVTAAGADGAVVFDAARADVSVSLPHGTMVVLTHPSGRLTLSPTNHREFLRLPLWDSERLNRFLYHRLAMALVGWAPATPEPVPPPS